MIENIDTSFPQQLIARKLATPRSSWTTYHQSLLLATRPARGVMIRSKSYRTREKLCKVD